MRTLTKHKFQPYIFAESDLNLLDHLPSEQIEKLEDEHNELLHASRVSEGVIAKQTPSGSVKALPTTIPQAVRESKGYDTEPNKIPTDMASRKAWACSFLDDSGELNKRPMMDRTKAASSTDQSTWQEAGALVTYEPARYGFMLSNDDPYVVIDLDEPKNANAEDEQEAFQVFAAKIIERFASYTEVSNSGKGYHIFIKGDLATCGDRCRTGNVEIYETGRYLIMTGNKIEGAPDEPQAKQEELAAFYAETFPPIIDERPEAPFDSDSYDATIEEIQEIIKKPCFFKTLAAYNGQSTKGNEGSELDGEFCMRMAFFTRNPETIYELWLESPIAREKVIKKGKKWFMAQNVASAIRAQKDSFTWEPQNEDAPEYFDFTQEKEQQESEKDAEKGALTAKLMKRARYDETSPPPPSPAVASLGDTEVIWKGNVHTLVAGSKVGKSRFLAALIRSMVKGERTLGWSKNDGGAKVIYLDFEQDKEDFYDSMHRQAGVTKDEVYAYNLSGVSATQAILCVDEALEMHPDSSMMLLDGVADLCNNVNDPEEPNRLIAHLMAQASEHDIAVVGVLHLNPGSDAKSRGHLGSHLERKSKTIIQINHDDDGVRTVFTKLARKKPILEKDGIRFHWCDNEGNFVELQETKAQEKQRGDTEDLREIMREIVEGRVIKNFTHRDLVEELEKHTKKGNSSCKKMVRNMKDWGVLTLSGKQYYLSKTPE